MAHQLKLFLDSVLDAPVRRFTFPRTEIGKSSDIDFYIKNTSEKWPIVEIVHNKTAKDIQILDLPQTLRADQKTKCRVRYTPAMNTDDKVTAILDITAELHIG